MLLRKCFYIIILRVMAFEINLYRSIIDFCFCCIECISKLHGTDTKKRWGIQSSLRVILVGTAQPHYFCPLVLITESGFMTRQKFGPKKMFKWNRSAGGADCGNHARIEQLRKRGGGGDHQYEINTRMLRSSPIQFDHYGDWAVTTVFSVWRLIVREMCIPYGPPAWLFFN